ncbi:MAG: sirohydrochlorin chelatase [Phycisphaerae bacterium]
MAADAVLLLAHGSRNPQWNQPLENLLDGLVSTTGREELRICFLQFGQPDLATTLQVLGEANAKRIQILPLFFSSGGHVQKDIPAIVAEAQQKYDLSVEVLPAVGEMPEFADMLRQLLQRLA